MTVAFCFFRSDVVMGPAEVGPHRERCTLSD